MLWADEVLRDRTAALHAHVRQQAMRSPRRTSDGTKPRARTRIGVRLTPVLIAALTLALGVFGGTAYAYFAVTGSGTGQANVSTLSAVVVLHATGTPATSLFPGQSANLRLTLTNPNPHPVTVAGITQDGPVAVVGGTGCTSTNSGVSVPTKSSLTTVTLSPGTHSFTLATGASMATTSPTGCQGASFQVPVTVTVKSVKS